MSASARYIIAADDRTKAAIASAKNGFRSLESGVRGTVTRLNALFGVLAGFGVAQGLRKTLAETGRSNKEFGKSLDEVRAAARNLLSAKEGAPAATAAMRELAATLKDPSVVAAVDSLTSSAIRGFAGMAGAIAKAAGAFGDFQRSISGEGADALQRQIDQRTEQLRHLVGGPDRERIEGELAALQRQLAARTQRGGPSRRGPDPVARALGRSTAAGERASHIFEVNREFESLSKWLEDFVKQEDDWIQMQRKASKELTDLTRKTAEERVAAVMKFREETGKTFDQQLEQQRRLKESNDENLRAISERWKETWGSIFQNWYLGGQRTGRNLAKAILAELASAQFKKALDSIFSKLNTSKSGSGGGIFGAIIGAIGSLFGGGKASGGPVSAGKAYMVGERGPEIFAPNASGRIIPNHQLGHTVVINNNVDARGASQEFIARLPAVLRANNEQLEAKIVEGIQRRRYDLG